MEETTQTQEERGQECLRKLNEVLKEYELRLVPTFNLVPAPTPVEEVPDVEVTTNDGTDESDPESPNT